MNRARMKKIYHRRLLLCLVLLAFAGTFSITRGHAGGAGNEGNRQTQMQLNKEACDDYKKADLEMNRAYQTILRDHRDEASFIPALRKAQGAWIRYRDAHLESLYPGDASQYGSINPMCRCLQLANITKERTKTLNQWVEGVEGGDVCAGSVKSRE